MRHTHSTGGVILNAKKQVVVVSQGGTSWSLPKGHIEEGEDLLDTARREIYEETGLTDLQLLKDLGSYERFSLRDNEDSEDPELKVISMFLFKTSQEELKPIDPENPEARWIDINEVVNLLTHPKDKEFFIEVKDYIEKVNL